MVGNDAIKNEFERSVANVDAMKYKCWRTKKSFLNSFTDFILSPSAA